MSACLLIHVTRLSMHGTEKFAKKLIGDNDIEAVVQRLDRLTTDELKITATQTMEVVYGLFNNMKVVMDGTENVTWHFLYRVPTIYPFRWKGINRQSPKGSWYDKLAFVNGYD